MQSNNFACVVCTSRASETGQWCHEIQAKQGTLPRTLDKFGMDETRREAEV